MKKTLRIIIVLTLLGRWAHAQIPLPENLEQGYPLRNQKERLRKND